MKKIAFIGIILLAGLFSLQFLLVGPRSINVVKSETAVNSLDSTFVSGPVEQIEVIYICPDDSTTKKLIDKATSRLL